MTSADIRHIICALRSSPGGEQTANHAIELALEHQAALTFFQTVDARFIRRMGTRGGSLKGVYNELTEMAEFTLTILCRQAEERGVSAADFIVRQGSIRQELPQLLTEIDVQLLVMGRPKNSPGRSIFKAKELNDFVAELEQVGGLRVVQVGAA